MGVAGKTLVAGTTLVASTTATSLNSHARGEPCLCTVFPLLLTSLQGYHLYRCDGTNKFRYSLDGLGMLICIGILDFVHVLLMVVGHTKFSPDQVALAIARKYSHSDSIKHAIINTYIASFATVSVNDVNSLKSWR